MKITVSRKSRLNGVRYSCTQCAVALELQANGFTHTIVSQWKIRYRYNGVTHSINTPAHVANFIDLHDSGENPAPVTFEVPTNKAVEVTPKLTPLTLTRIDPDNSVAYAVPVDIFEKELA